MRTHDAAEMGPGGIHLQSPSLFATIVADGLVARHSPNGAT